MPTLTELDAPDPASFAPSLRQKFELRKIFHDVQLPPSDATARLLLAYVVIVDKAAREYSAGRTQLQAHANGSRGIAEYVEGVGSFENCINSAKRALRLLAQLGSQANAPRFDRTLRKLATVYADTVTEVRDAVEHIDKDIVSPEGIPEGAPHLLSVDSSGASLVIGETSIPFRRLHQTLSALHRAGSEMIDALPGATTADA